MGVSARACTYCKLPYKFQEKLETQDFGVIIHTKA